MLHQGPQADLMLQRVVGDTGSVPMVRDRCLLADSHALPTARLRLLNCEGRRAQDVLSHNIATVDRFTNTSLTPTEAIGEGFPSRSVWKLCPLQWES